MYAAAYRIRVTEAGGTGLAPLFDGYGYRFESPPASRAVTPGASCEVG